MKLAGTIMCLVLVTCADCSAQATVSKHSALSPKELSKLLPQRLAGYHMDGASTAKKITIGTLTYSICQRNFSRGKKSIQILLFDYLQAPIMYDQSIRKWNDMKPVSSDSIYFGNSGADSLRRFEAFRKGNEEAQIVMGIHHRFFLSATAAHLTFEELNAIVSKIDVSKFPK